MYIQFRYTSESYLDNISAKQCPYKSYDTYSTGLTAIAGTLIPAYSHPFIPLPWRGVRRAGWSEGVFGSRRHCVPPNSSKISPTSPDTLPLSVSHIIYNLQLSD